MRKFKKIHAILMFVGITPLIAGGFVVHLSNIDPMIFTIAGAGLFALWFAAGLLSAKYTRSKFEGWLLLNAFTLAMAIAILVPSIFLGFAEGGVFFGTSPMMFFYPIAEPITRIFGITLAVQTWLPLIITASLSTLSLAGILLGKKIFRQYRR